MTCEVR